MAISYGESILPMSELRMKLDKVKEQLKKTPIIITNKGRPDFGLCDLETLEIASQIKDLRDLLRDRISRARESRPAGEVFKTLESKFRG